MTSRILDCLDRRKYIPVLQVGNLAGSAIVACSYFSQKLTSYVIQAYKLPRPDEEKSNVASRCRSGKSLLFGSIYLAPRLFPIIPFALVSFPCKALRGRPRYRLKFMTP